MTKIQQYLLYSSVFAIFTEAFFFNWIIDWKLLYLIVFVNYSILIISGSLKIHKHFLYFLLALFIHGIIAYTIIDIPYNYMLSQILGIAIIGIYYYNFVSLFPIEGIIKVYTRLCIYVAVIGYILWFILRGDPDYRLMSIFKEPAHYVIVVIPACYYFLKLKSYTNFLIIFGTLILSNSSLGYIGCGLMFILPALSLKRIGRLMLTLPVLISAFVIMYNELPFFNMRVKETYESLKAIDTGKFKEETNLSSFVLINNIFIAKENVIDHPLGSGIGSHHYQHTQRYIHEARPPRYLVQQGRHVDNSFDANSMFIRIVSEFGLIGFITVVLGLWLASYCFKHNSLYLAQGIFIYILLKLFRDGHYFPPELFFFIWLFYFLYKKHIRIKA